MFFRLKILDVANDDIQRAEKISSSVTPKL
jgi:hypothetical protein